MIRVSDTIEIDETEIHEEFIRSSGPGGQNVNKVASAVQVRFDVLHSPSLPGEVRERLISIAGDRITAEGILIIDARRFRSQKANREDAVDRLVELVRRAALKPRVRRKTRPTAASRAKAREAKRRRARIKKLRSRVSEEE